MPIRPLRIAALFPLFIFAACAASPRTEKMSNAAIDLAAHVDPFIGTDGFGHTFPGATVPFGMVQLSPDTRTDGWENCSGYHSSNPTILGFSHTHLSGTGCADFGDILIMPSVGALKMEPGDENRPGSGYRSTFDHTTEIATPGFYQVYLKEPAVTASLTATEHCGLHCYEFSNATDKANIIIDLNHGIGDRTSECKILTTGSDRAEGYRRSRGWAADQKIFFVIQFSKAFDSNQAFSAAEPRGRSDRENDQLALQFRVARGEKIFVKVGISHVDIEGARKNLEAEIPGFDFNKTRGQARERWNQALHTIRAEAPPEKLKIFYTALYHSMIAPNLLSDVDGRHPGMDHKIHNSERPVYHVFSLWDTFRALHPLFTIIDPARDADFINSLLVKYKESGTLPVWELAANETNCMIGYHSIPVIVDAWMKGIRIFDGELALAAMKKSANEDRLGLKYYKSAGYIPVDKENEGVSKALEYAYDDWCISEMARDLGHERAEAEFLRRGKSYINNFDASVGFMRAKKSGSWAAPFDPGEVSGYFTEANSWQYSFFAPQDIRGLIALYGGDERFIHKLELLFETKQSLTGRNQVDISGLIGQYAHGNEPSHHAAYLFNYAGAPWRTQRRVREICDKFYNSRRDGICGNDDCGQMSAWYVFSTLGFYPVTPGIPVYAIGSPSLERAELSLPGGRRFVMIAENQRPENIYIQSATLNGKPLSNCYIQHSEIKAGGELRLVLGPQPAPGWGAAAGSRPPSAISIDVAMAPFVVQSERTFNDRLRVELSSHEPNVNIYYSVVDGEPDASWKVYDGPVEITKTCTLRARAERPGAQASSVLAARFVQLPHSRIIKYTYPYAHQYTGGGEFALLDGVHAEPGSFGEWQGFEGTNFEAVVDLGSVQRVRRISSRYLQNYGAWVFQPLSVEYLASEDGGNYRTISIINNTISANEPGPVTSDYTYKSAPIRTRFIKVVAKTRGVCPPGHPGEGGKCWIFVDEIEVD